MFSPILIFAAAAFTGLASAQNYSTSGAIAVVPSSVPYDTRLSWCRAQTNSCPQICGGQASPNTCDANTLNYTCTCTNGQSPNISSYDQTIPSFECAQWKADCVQAHPNDLTGQTACLSVTCGSLNASSGESIASSSSSMASTMATATASSSGSAGSSSASATGSSGSGSSASSTASSSGGAASASSSSAAVAISVAKNYGTGILATGLLALFGLAL